MTMKYDTIHLVIDGKGAVTNKSFVSHRQTLKRVNVGTTCRSTIYKQFLSFMK